jgi:hypothetical protein
MKSWKKENKIMMKLNYYTSEVDDNKETFVEHWLEGQRVYLNFPDATDFISVIDKEGIIHSIMRRNINRIIYDNIPSVFMLDEKNTMESARLRMEMLTQDLENQREHLTQQKELSKMKKNGDVGSV